MAEVLRCCRMTRRLALWRAYVHAYICMMQRAYHGSVYGGGGGGNEGEASLPLARF